MEKHPLKVREERRKMGTNPGLFLRGIWLLSRVQCGQGGIYIIIYIVVGSSVQSQRIERLWRDLHLCVTTIAFR